MDSRQYRLNRADSYLKSILSTVVTITGITAIDIKGKRKNTPELVLARQLYCYAAYNYRPTDISIESIGAYINKHHASIIYGKNKVLSKIDINDTEAIALVGTFHDVYEKPAISKVSRGDGLTFIRIREKDYIALLKKEELLTTLVKENRALIRSTTKKLRKLTEI